MFTFALVVSALNPQQSQANGATEIADCAAFVAAQFNYVVHGLGSSAINPTLQKAFDTRTAYYKNLAAENGMSSDAFAAHLAERRIRYEDIVFLRRNYNSGTDYGIRLLERKCAKLRKKHGLVDLKF